MRIVYQAGNFLDGPEPVSCHGCNMQGRMGGSVATQVRERFPRAFDAYLRAHETRGLRLGETIVAAAEGRVIANAVTQRFYGNSRKTGIRYLSYEGLAAAIAALDLFAAEGGPDAFGTHVPSFDAVAFPPIGAGLAGGEWRRIAAIIEAGSRSFEPVVYTADGRPPD